MGKRERNREKLGGTGRETLVARHLAQFFHFSPAATKLELVFSLGDPIAFKFCLKERHTLLGFSKLEKSKSMCSTAPRKGVAWKQSWWKCKDVTITLARKKQ